MICVFVSSRKDESVRLTVITQTIEKARKLAESKFRELGVIGRPYFIGL